MVEGDLELLIFLSPNLPSAWKTGLYCHSCWNSQQLIYTHDSFKMLSCSLVLALSHTWLLKAIFVQEYSVP